MTETSRQAERPTLEETLVAVLQKHDLLDLPDGSPDEPVTAYHNLLLHDLVVACQALSPPSPSEQPSGSSLGYGEFIDPPAAQPKAPSQGEPDTGVQHALDYWRSERKRLLAAIRKHADAKGHDRCWLNDRELYAAIGIEFDPQLPPKGEFLSMCHAYYDAQCSQPAPSPTPGEAEALAGLTDFVEWHCDRDTTTQRERVRKVNMQHLATLRAALSRGTGPEFWEEMEVVRSFLAAQPKAPSQGELEQVRELVQKCYDLQNLWVSLEDSSEVDCSDMHEAIDAVCVAVGPLVPTCLSAPRPLQGGEECTVHCALCGVPDGDAHDADCPYREVTYDLSGPGEPKVVEAEEAMHRVASVVMYGGDGPCKLCDEEDHRGFHAPDCPLEIISATLRAALSRGTGEQDRIERLDRIVRSGSIGFGWNGRDGLLEIIDYDTDDGVGIVLGRGPSLSAAIDALPAPPSPLAQEKS